MNLRPKIALDIGSSVTKAESNQTEVRCPSVVLRDAQSDRTVAVGEQAVSTDAEGTKEYIYPIKDGVMNHYGAGQALIRHVMYQLLPWWTLLRPTVVLSKSQLAQPAQLQQVRQATRLAGGGSVFAADTTALAALGSGTAADNSRASLVVDIGSGTTEAAIVVRATPVVYSAKAVGGDDMVATLQEYCKDHYDITISKDDAETCLAKIGSAISVDSADSFTVSGEEGVRINTNDIADAINPVLKTITELIQEVMRDSSAALLSDVAEKGVTLTGGVAKLNNLDTRLSRRLAVPVAVADKPESAVMRGAQIAHKFVGMYRESTKRNLADNRKRV